MMKRNTVTFFGTFLCLALLLTACGKENKTPDGSGPTKDPVTGNKVPAPVAAPAPAAGPVILSASPNLSDVNGTWRIDHDANKFTVYTVVIDDKGNGTIKEEYSDKGKVTSKVLKLTKLPGRREVQVFEKFVPTGVATRTAGKGLLGKAKPFKFEIKVIEVDGKPALDGRMGHQVMQVVTLDGKSHLLNSGALIHGANGGSDEWKGKDVIETLVKDEDADRDYFRRVSAEKMPVFIK